MNQSYQVVLDQAEDTLNDELLLKDRKFKDFYAEIKGRECDMQVSDSICTIQILLIYMD